jgi:DNA-binding CsgD family transcriptional regulator
MNSPPSALYATSDGSRIQSLLKYSESIEGKIEKMIAEHERLEKLNSTLKQTHNPYKLTSKKRKPPENMTKKEQEQIHKLYAEGKTQKQIGKIVGRSQSAVCATLRKAIAERKFGRPPKVDAELEKKIVALWKSGKRVNQIATTLGIAQGSARYWVVKNGFAPSANIPPTTKKTIERHAGKPVKAIADKCKTSPKYVKRVLKEKACK